jgi:hypothetical protein
VILRQVQLPQLFKDESSYTPNAANNDFALIRLDQPIGRKYGYLGLQESSKTSGTVALTTAGAQIFHHMYISLASLDQTVRQSDSCAEFPYNVNKLQSDDYWKTFFNR